MKQFFTTLCTALFISSFTLAATDHSGMNGDLTERLTFKKNTLHLLASFPSAPVIGAESKMILEARDATTNQAIELTDQVAVELFMPSMGHGSAPTTVAKMIGVDGQAVVGVLEVTNLYFIMGGDWQVRVTLTDNKGQTETQSFDLKLSGGHGSHGH